MAATGTAQWIIIYRTPRGMHAYATAYDQDQAADAICDCLERFGAGTAPHAILASGIRPDQLTVR